HSHSDFATVFICQFSTAQRGCSSIVSQIFGNQRNKQEFSQTRSQFVCSFKNININRITFKHILFINLTSFMRSALSDLFITFRAT
ncbi:9222_t:CDS:2, partial [Dentiscutata erythropus]